MNTVGGSVLIHWPNIFWIKACSRALGCFSEFVLRCKKIIGLAPAHSGLLPSQGGLIPGEHNYIQVPVKLLLNAYFCFRNGTKEEETGWAVFGTLL